MVDTARTRPGGRTARNRAAVLDATVAELVARGYAGLSVEAVAARCNVNKTTIYRRWSSKEGLVVDAVETFAADQAVVPDSGDIDEDLRLWAHSVRATLCGPNSGPVVRALFGGAGDTPAVRALRHRFWLVRSARVLPVVDRAVDRGQLPEGTNSGELIRFLSAPLYYRLLVLDEPLTADHAELTARVTAIAAHAGAFVLPRSSSEGA